ncbi:MAG: NAD(P)-dependent oxidoreductase [Chloroflexi bacterium]|nr:NAD(P)-dependent oxidoreductase [Chloroflexota bacterium]MBV6437304.1 3 beta-hydroxysteroid dehydrogenase/Delta 5-->4-isomerase [Anaerolineae bacterium]MBW7878042.1 NAD(P)-dependent oxidoreductase [Anaerolineae bacterium]MDL1915339.1 NAD(P)-dependent oxidoreductase [Anaerolineae bacterium CFX4]RIK22201.1 MAG: epimerase [Chloroflexota bacterium]
MSQTYLITGGAGFLGINMARYLLARGDKVASLDIAPFDYPERPQITEVRGDIRSRADVDRAMQGVDIVIHTAAALPLYKKEDIFSTDIDGTRTVCESAHAHGVKRFIHISSTAVYGVPDHHPLYENDELIGVGPYGIAKIKAEEVCLEYRAKGMCVSVIRPKSFIGQERLGVFALLYDWAKDGKNFPIPGKGDNLYQYLDVEDLCDAIYLCATLPEDTVNDTFNVGAKEFGTFKGDFQAVLDHVGKGRKVVSIPVAPALWALRILDRLNLSPLYPWVYETAIKDSFVSIEKAEQKLGWTPKFSNKDALIRNYDWYVANLAQFENKSGISHRVPWKQGALRIAKLFF